MDADEGGKITKGVLLSDIPAATTRFYVEQANPSNADASRDIGVDLAYNVATRTLTYTLRTTISGYTVAVDSIKAIGGSLATGVAAEQAARIAADTALDARIADEVTARTNADATLQLQIDNLDRSFTLDPDYFVRDTDCLSATAV